VTWHTQYYWAGPAVIPVAWGNCLAMGLKVCLAVLLFGHLCDLSQLLQLVNRIQVSLEVTLPTAVLGCIGPGMPGMLHIQMFAVGNTHCAIATSCTSCAVLAGCAITAVPVCNHSPDLAHARVCKYKCTSTLHSWKVVISTVSNLRNHVAHN
jgi:hypothetical protein